METEGAIWKEIGLVLPMDHQMKIQFLINENLLSCMNYGIP